jgi:flagellar hook-basal body complex protein FliE
MIPAIGASLPRLQTGNVETGLAASGASPVGKTAGADFSVVLSKIAQDAVTTVQSAEAVSIKGINGGATTQAVVEAVMEAERTLQTAVSIRDKAVSAYMELSRMAI